jgi:hypothetical protein
MKYNMQKIITILFFSLLSQCAFAWGITGHRVIAEIAERHLTKNAKKNLSLLIGREPLAYWANWADFIKSDTTEKWKGTGPWHYVDLPAGLDESEFADKLKSINEKNLYTQIPAMEKILRSKRTSLTEKQEALHFLIHLVGDMEQPLHVGHSEDLGGNRIEEYWFNRRTNLHTIWDEDLVDYQKWSYTEYVTNIDVASDAEIRQMQSGTLEDWLYQTYQLAQEVYDETPANAKLGYDYNYLFYYKLNKQLLMGGLRLAKILNDILG